MRIPVLMLPLFWRRSGSAMTVMSLLLLVAVVCAEGPLYSLYSDKKARKVEDVITVEVIENAKATNDSKTQTDKKQDASIAVNAGTGRLDFIPGMGAGMGISQAYDGSGATSRNGEVKATVSARIVRVYENGNLLIDGHKEVTVNGEKEVLKVSGIVRPEDIAADNTVLSSKLAEARIEYTGEGDAHQASKPGWIARFFNWIF
jgi:flagellar L-ring protein FlgH